MEILKKDGCLLTGSKLSCHYALLDTYLLLLFESISLAKKNFNTDLAAIDNILVVIEYFSMFLFEILICMTGL